MGSVPAYVPAGSGTPSTPSGATVAGPDAAGLNPADAGVSANDLDPSIALKALPGGGTVGGSPGVPAKPYSEKQLVQELADQMGVKATKGKPLEISVIDALASKYNVHLDAAGLTTSGTGTGQGALGQARHNLMSWFETGAQNTSNALSPNKASAFHFTPQHYEQAVADAHKIKDPKLRQQALTKLEAVAPPQAAKPVDEGGSPATPKPVPNKNALNDMLAGVAEKLGVDPAAIGQGGLANIARGEHLATAFAATAAVAGRQQTAGDAYQSFVKELADPKNGAKFAAANVPALEAAGLLDRNEAGAKQLNGTTFTNTQIASAYQKVLQQQVTKNQTESQALSALASTTNISNAPTSEMQAYVQGVAQEFGVGLTAQQVTEIANTYGANALVAGQPSSVEDEIKDAVVALYDPNNPNNPAGVADTMFTNIKQAALQYQIPISDQQIGNMVKTSIQGATVESMYVAADSAQSAAIKQFQEQAQGLYPALSAQIQAGQTVQNLVTPYFNVAEAITGVPAATMMADQRSGGLSKWSGFLQGGQNPAGATKTAPGTSPTGSGAQAGPQMMTLDEWRKTLMKDPQYGFQNTQGGRDMAEQMSAAILNEFGKVNTLGSQPFNVYDPSAALAANRGGG